MMEAQKTDAAHHHNYATTVAHLLCHMMLTLADSPLVPLNLGNAAREVEAVLWQTQERRLKGCNGAVPNLSTHYNTSFDAKLKEGNLIPVVRHFWQIS